MNPISTKNETTCPPTAMTVDDEVLVRWGELAESSSHIEPALYEEFAVKRGLRDITGQGVRAGLTQIGDVLAYSAEGDTLTPVPGRLVYRGIDIDVLVDGFVSENRVGFEETCYLLLFGELPSAEELCLFEARMAVLRPLPTHFIHDAILRLPSNNVMNAMTRSVLALYALDGHPDDTSIPAILRQCLRMIATFPVLAVYSYQASVHHFQNRSLVIHAPVTELSTAENILHMLRPDSRYTELEAKVLDISLVLQAEHGGGNNSTFTTHVVSSTGTDTYSAIAASLCSLKGPKHGGANIKVAQMFDDLTANVGNLDDDSQIEEYLCKILDKKAFDGSGLIYGMGHPVYSISDPRNLILKEYARMLAKEKGCEAEFDLHARVEEMAAAAIGSKRKVYKGVSANVDFYSGFVYQMLGIPVELYTPLFAVARVVGWSAHRIEEVANGGKIIRPAYKAVASERDYVPLADR